MEVHYFTILYWFCHTSAWIRHRYTRVPHPELIFKPFYLINWFFHFCKSLQNFYHVTGTVLGDRKYERLLTLRNLWTSEGGGHGSGWLQCKEVRDKVSIPASCLISSSQHACLATAPLIEFLVMIPQYRPLPQAWHRLPAKTCPLVIFLGLCADAVRAVKNAPSQKGQRTA